MRAGILDVVETDQKLWKEKASVPGPGPAATVGKALLSPQRHTQVLDVNPFANTAFADVQTAVLAEFGQAQKNDVKYLCRSERDIRPAVHSAVALQIF